MKRTPYACVLVTLLTIACTKENATQESSADPSTKPVTADVRPMACMVTRQWAGYYSQVGQASVRSGPFISGGIARVYGSSPFTGAYFTGISPNLDGTTPYCGFYPAADGDNIRFTARVKNPQNIPGSFLANDVTLVITGANNTARVNLVSNAGWQSFTRLDVSEQGLSNLPELVRPFQDWTDVSLQTANGVLTLYINGTVIRSLSYAGKTIGWIKSLTIGFKGSGSVDRMELRDAATQQMIMVDEFSQDYGMLWNGEIQ